jgi:hypothetical protein
MIRKPIHDFFLFLVGSALFAAGIFLFSNQVFVNSGYRGFGWGSYGFGWGRSFGGFFPFGVGQGFGLLMIPFGVGVALLLADAYRRIAWFLIWASSAAIGVGVLHSLVFNFRTTSLFSLMAMVLMIGCGAGLMFKSLKGYEGDEANSNKSTIDEANQRIKDLEEDLERLKSKIDPKK